MALLDGQWSYGGLTFGAGTDIRVLSLPVGVRDFVARSASTIRPRDHGSFVGDAWVGSKEPQIELMAMTRAAEIAVEEVFAPGGDLAALSFKFQGRVQQRVYARPTRWARPHTREADGVGRATVMMAWEQPDPRVFSEEEHSTGIVLSSQTGGMEFPVTFPLTFGSGGAGTGLILNAGNFGARPIVTITGGEVVGPRLEHVGRDESIRLPGFTLPAGSTLSVDFDARTVLLGAVSRYSYLSTDSVWWQLDPGSNEIRFSSLSGDPAVTATVTWRDAWLP